MNERKNQLERGVRQALYYISRQDLIPANNILLWSPLITQRLTISALEDTPEARQLMLEIILDDLVDAYAAEEPENRRKRRVHHGIIRVLTNLLNGTDNRRDIPEGTYERHHADGIKVLAEKFADEEKELKDRQNDSSFERLQAARRTAQEFLRYLGTMTKINFFDLDKFTEATTVIADYNYFEEAQPYFEKILEVLETGPLNLVTLRRKIAVANATAHCLMNQGEIKRAILRFDQMAHWAEEMSDWENKIHGTHMLGVNYNINGDHDLALTCFEDAIGWSLRGERPEHRKAWIQRDQISALVKKGHFDRIPALAKSSLHIREKIGEESGYMMTLEVWGRAYTMQGDFKNAELLLTEAHHMIHHLPDEYKLMRTQIFATLAELYVVWGKQEIAMDYINRAKTLATEYGFWHQFSKLNQITEKGFQR